MAFTNPSTFVAGAVLTAAQMNANVRDNTKFLARPPSARVQRNAAQSIPDNLWEEISFDAEIWDTDTIWSSTAATKLFARTAGKYLVTAAGGFVGSTAGTFRGIGVRKNSTSGDPTDGEIVIDPGANTARTVMTITSILSMTTSDYVQVVQIQNTGGALNTDVTGSNTAAAMLWVSS